MEINDQNRGLSALRTGNDKHAEAELWLGTDKSQVSFLEAPLGWPLYHERNRQLKVLCHSMEFSRGGPGTLATMSQRQALPQSLPGSQHAHPGDTQQITKQLPDLPCLLFLHYLMVSILVTKSTEE